MAEGIGLPFGTALDTSSSTGVIGITPTPRIICPFYNMNGRRGAKGRACTGAGYPNIHRAKEHLYRVHALPISCPRCYAVFIDQNEVNEHLRNEDICELMPPPAIDETTTFTERKRQELKRKSPRCKGNPNEVEQIKEIYGILFPGATIPDSLYVRDDEPRPRLERGEELTIVISKLLVEKVPMEARYAGLASQLDAIKESVRELGIMDEAANLVTNGQKRRRVSNDQPHIICDEPHMVAGNPTKSINYVDIAPFVSAAADRSQSSQSPGKLSSYLPDNLPTSSWSAEPCGVLDAAIFPSFDLNTTEQIDYGSDVIRDHFSEAWHLDRSESTALPSDGQTEVGGVHAEDLEFEISRIA